MTVLLAIVIFGPCDVFAVQSRTNQLLDDAVDRMGELHQSGLIRNTTGILWEATEAGRLAAETHDIPSVNATRRDESRACVGVRA